MGRIVSNRSLTAKELLQLKPPVILCTNRPDLERAINESGYQTVSLNLPLAQSIINLDLREVCSVLPRNVQEILPPSKPVYLVDYEMLFDPRYEVDVLRLFVDIARRNKLIVKWCGKVDGETLTYAEQGYADYKRYKINDYDVVIVNGYGGYSR